MSALAQTPLHDWHATHGGRMVDFAGWSMPVQYSSIVSEHQATRNAIGLFDVSHMGRIRFDGPGAESFLDRLVTRRVAGQAIGQIRYALVTNHDGGILDDVLVYRLAERDGGKPYFQLVVNASNRRKILTWIDAQLTGVAGVEYRDRTAETAMIAVQGPKVIDILRPLVNADLAAMKYYTGLEALVSGVPAIVSRTGYTGEDGWELVVPADSAVTIWNDLLAKGEPLGALAAGLGCRDTLRLEAAMPLYGHELNESIDPLQAGLGFAVDLEGRQFPGRDALANLKDQPQRPKRVGLELSGKRAAREGYAIFSGEQKIGDVTSGTFSPTLDRPIAMGYVDPKFAAIGTEVEIDIRGRKEKARVVKLPFYKRSK